MHVVNESLCYSSEIHQIKSHNSQHIHVFQVKEKGSQNGRSVTRECAPPEDSMDWFFSGFLL